MPILVFTWNLIEISAFIAFYCGYYYKGSIKFFYKFYTVTLKCFIIPGSAFTKNSLEVFKKISKGLTKGLLVILFSNSWKGLTEIFENFPCRCPLSNKCCRRMYFFNYHVGYYKTGKYDFSCVSQVNNLKDWKFFSHQMSRNRFDPILTKCDWKCPTI